jgi:predicted metal-dependent hydrolase
MDLGFRWGSYRDGRMNVNWATIALPPSVIDYVIVHELAHVEHAHHGEGFWAAVRRAMPDHEARKRWLAEHGAEHGL